MPDPIEALRVELARLMASPAADKPQIEHLRWQLVSLKRQAHRQRPRATDAEPSRPIAPRLAD